MALSSVMYAERLVLSVVDLIAGNIGRGGEKSEDILKLVLDEYANIRSVH
jgi:hypothetical protein